MKKFLSNAFGFGSPMDFVTGLILILLGLLILGDGQIGIQATSTGEVKWITAFDALPNWFGWMFFWFGINSFFDGKPTKLLIDKVLSPLLNLVARAVVGEERLKRIQTQLEGKDKTVE